MIRLTCLLSVALVGSCCAQELYRDQIRPLFEKNCLACHGPQMKQAGLDLSTRESLLRGGDSGAAVVPGNPDASQLYKLVSHQKEPGMPFKGAKLPDEAITRIGDWIKAGAPFDQPATASAVPVESDHWAFRLPARPKTPLVKSKAWVRNPIDAFLAAELERRGLTPLPEADRRTLLRRVSLDLTGLAPTAEETRAFLADQSNDAYERTVDRLLASPRYGERWGRHWLDIWRYSDWYGYRKANQVRYSQRHIWRWRDWTIDSLNGNKSYAEMIREMLAGDEIAPADPAVVAATGYLARNWYRFNRNVWLQDTVEYTAGAFLGLTMKCARCHTHKYDPILHTDYYRFRAFFEPHDIRTDRVAGEPDVVKAGFARAYDGDAGVPTFRFLRGNEDAPDKDNPLTPGVPEFLAKGKLDIQPKPLPREAWYPDGREFVQKDLVAEAKAEIEKSEAALAKAREEKSAEKVTAAEKHLATARAALPAIEARIAADRAKYATPPDAEADKLADQARKLERAAGIVKAEEDLYQANLEFERAKGDEKKLTAAKKKLQDAVAALSVATDSYTPIGKVYPETTSGRRLALANWIASKDNPLTARVAINHMWLRHFGKALVPTVFNFGKSGKPPSHPELLDWLATEFMAHDWDMKHIHRLMVTSSAYQMRSPAGTGAEANRKIDPDNVYYWRMNARRMEAEAVRDSLLLLGGKLDETRGGPELDETKGQEIYRRSIYFRTSPDLQMEMLKVFDQASPNECFERTESVVPQQALALANSSLSFAIARSLSARLEAEAPSTEKFVSAAFGLILGRPPSAVEAAESIDFMTGQAALYRDPARLSNFQSGEAAEVAVPGDPDARAKQSLTHVLLNHNDFVTIR